MFVYEPSGPHPVGAFDLLTNHGNEGILARVFYPTADAVGDGHAYTEPEYALGLVDFVRINRWLGRFMVWATAHLRLCCAWHGRPCEAAERLPLIVYSHGLGGQRHLYSSVCVELASHGFVVAAVEHRDGSASMTFAGELDDGGAFRRRWMPYWRHPLSDFPVRNRQVKQRASECQQLTELMLRLNAEGRIDNCLPGADDRLMDLFRDRIDTDRIHVMGHSFGGATAFTVAANDDKGIYKTCCLHDVWMHPIDPEQYGAVQIPAMFINNEKFHWETNVKRILATMETMEEAKKTALTIRGTNHAAQSDSGLFLPLWISRKLGFTAKLEPREALRLTARLSRIFIYRHEGRQLSSEDENLLNGKTDACTFEFSFGPDNPIAN